MPTQPELTSPFSTPSHETPTLLPTPRATITPSPTSQSTATDAPTNTPTIQPSPTLAALLPVDETRQQYWEETLPLANQLLQAPPAPEGFPLPAVEESQIILVPLSERLHYLQTILYPQETLFGTLNLPAQFYVLYDYQRDAELATTENAYYAVTRI